ncbi:hypothetical protein Tco_1022491 [Tanacetum coccineum]
MVVESELDTSTRIGGWVEMNNSGTIRKLENRIVIFTPDLAYLWDAFKVFDEMPDKNTISSTVDCCFSVTIRLGTWLIKLIYSGIIYRLLALTRQVKLIFDTFFRSFLIMQFHLLLNVNYYNKKGVVAKLPTEKPLKEVTIEAQKVIAYDLVVGEYGEGSGVHWWRRVEKVVVGRRRYGGVIVVGEIEWKMKKIWNKMSKVVENVKI